MKLSTARITGLLYIGLVVTGMFVFLFVRDKLLVDGDAVATATNLVENEGLARLGIAAEIALAGFQALTAVWFYKLFRSKNGFVAGLIPAFGLVNATAILIASAMWITSLSTAMAGGQAEGAYVLFGLHDSIWAVANLFFGLWLLPMAYMTIASKMPRVLGWFLAAGGIGYILAAFTSVLLPEQTTLTESLPLAAIVGEFWIIGYMLFKGVKE